MIKEYLDYKKACKLQDEFSKVMPIGVECILVRQGRRYKETELKIQNNSGAVKELSRKENNIMEIIEIIFNTCKKFHLSFSFHSHGLDYVYISVEVK